MASAVVAATPTVTTPAACRNLRLLNNDISDSWFTQPIIFANVILRLTIPYNTRLEFLVSRDWRKLLLAQVFGASARNPYLP
jgi:hypothetical protein